jgi:hypothetical protein
VPAASDLAERGRRFEAAIAAGTDVSTGTFSVGGRRLAVRCAGGRHWHDLTRAYLPAPAGGADFTLDLWDADETGIERLERVWPPPGIEPGDPVRVEALGVSPDGRHLRSFGPAFDVLLDWESRHAVGWVAAGGLTAFQRNRPWQSLLTAALAREGVETVHAAMAARDGAGVLLTGPDGSGKSTTTFACLAAGLEILGDDAICLERRPGARTVTAHALHAVAKLSVDGLAAFPELAAETERYEDPARDERALRLGAGARSGRAVPSASLAALAFPRLGAGQASAVRPLAGSRAAPALLQQALSAEPGRLERVFETLTEVAASVPAFALEVGRDPAGLAAAVDEILERVAGADAG